MKQRGFPLCLTFFALATACAKVFAGEHPSEQDFFQELPVVLSASRLSQPISETPNAITVIDREMIVASGARNIADLFKLVPGMYVGYKSGHTPVVAYHGTTDEFARRMQVLIDGRSIYLPIFGQVDWAELPLDINDIDRIEVIRGPSAASHGSNSVQGVISIFTHQASNAPKAQVSVSKGNGGISDVLARFGAMGESWDYRVTVASRGDSGLDPILFASGKIPLNDTSRTKLINARIDYRPNDSNSFDIQLGYSDSLRELGDRYTDPANNTIRDQKTSSDFEQITWIRTFNEHSDIQLKYYHMGRNMKDDRYTGSTTAPFPAITDIFVQRHDVEVQHTLTISPVNRIVWGAGARQDSANAPTLLKYSPDWREYRLFAHDEWRVTQTSLINAGVMVEKNPLGQTRASPRVSYNYHLTPQDTLRASYSVAYRNPEMLEELGKSTSSNIASVGGLSPEKAISREIGYIRQLDESGSMIDIRAYHDQIDNTIWIDPSLLNPKSFKGDFDLYYSGLEATLKYKLGARSNLTVNYAHQIMGATPAHNPPLAARQALLQSYAQRFVLSVPLHSGSVLFSHDFSGGLNLGAGYYQTGPIKLFEASDWYQPLARYLDLRIAQRFGGWQSKKEKSGGGEIALVMQNALSDHYYDYSQETRYKRRAYLTVTLGL
jgi:iron complex outermembrane receptor protein